VDILLDSAFSGRRVLVTGHTGFKGSWLAAWLDALGAKVVGLSLDPNEDQRLFGQLNLGERLQGDYRVDIRDSVTVAEVVRREAPEFVFHLAAQPLVRLSYEAPAETFEVNVQGVVNVLEAVRVADRPCTVVVATTDKCYENRGWLHAYREEDPLGGHDPYSASKAAAELVVAAYRRSFFADCRTVKLASARAGNVIGGGDGARDRIVPDCIRALRRGLPIAVRNKTATRPWQHVLEPLSGYLQLAAAMDDPTRVQGARHCFKGEDEAPVKPEAGTRRTARREPRPPKSMHDRDGGAKPCAVELCGPFNFGPNLSSNRTVAELVEELLHHTPGVWEDRSDPMAPHEASKLNLAIDKAHHALGWRPVWSFEETVRRTVEWYRAEDQAADLVRFTAQQIREYRLAAESASIPWARAA
jgi:CDP-glucose 4,6-dehydratase